MRFNKKGKQMKPKVKFLICYSLAVLLFGCTYHGNLRNDFHIMDQSRPKLPLKACLVFDNILEGTHYKKENIYFSHSVDIAAQPGMKQAMTNTFDSLFERVVVNSYFDEKKCGNADIVIFPTVEMRSDVMYMSISVKKFNTDEVLQKYESSGNVSFSTPASVHILNIFNIAFTAGLLSPIISPIITEIIGKQGQDVLETRISNCLNKIANDIRNDRSLIRADRVKPIISPAQVANRLPKIAVWDLTAGNINPSYAQDLTSILVSEISKVGKYEVYSQENVRTLAGWTAERMQLGCTDTKCLTALGQMDISKLLSGRVGKIGDTYSISLHLFDTQNIRAENSVSDECHSENELIPLVRQAVTKLLGENR